MITHNKLVEENHIGIADLDWMKLKLTITLLTVQSGCSNDEWNETFERIANSFLTDGVCCYVTAVYANYSAKEFGTSIALYCPLPQSKP